MKDTKKHTIIVDGECVSTHENYQDAFEASHIYLANGQDVRSL